MNFFRRKKPESAVFLLGDDPTLGVVREYAAGSFFDESLAESARLRDDPPTRQFIGVTLSDRRLRIGAIVLTTVFGLFLAKAAHLQVVLGDEFRTEAEGNRVRIEMIPSKRGIIYDRNRTPLAENASTFRLVATPATIPKVIDQRVAFLEELAEVTGTPVPQMLSILGSAANEKDPVVLNEALSYDAALSLMTQMDRFPGVQVESATIRTYKTDEIPTLSHVLGYTGRISAEEYDRLDESGYRMIDNIGKLGVEESYESVLRGTYGRKIVEVDALGRAAAIITKEDPIDGQNVILSIDATLTAKIEQVLEGHLGTSARAAVVMMDPTTGEILSLVSTPAFDSNKFAEGIDQKTYTALLEDVNRPLFNRAISGQFPSGSTFKPVVAAAALAEGLINRSTSFLSTGSIHVGIWSFYDWNLGGHGITNVTRALAESINTFFYYIGGGYDGFVGLGVERIMTYAARFGFGTVLGVDLPNEASGFLPSKVWKEEAKGERWYIGDTYNVSIGQGDLLVTPLQIASMTSTVANGGTLYQPRVMHALESEAGEALAEPIVQSEQVVDAQTIAIVRDGMRQAVTSGSARRLLSLPVTSAGKTGTAQWSSLYKTHAWFTGFAPFEDPQVVITVLIEEGGAGDAVAVPIAQEILAWWFTQFEIASPPPAPTPTPVENPLDANLPANYDGSNDADRPV